LSERNEPSSKRDWKNWAHTVCIEVEELYRPKGLDELKTAVADAVAKGQKLRAIGSGHSWSALGLPGIRVGRKSCDRAAGPQPKTALIFTDDLNKVLSIDRDRKRVWVEAGIKLNQLSEKLFADRLSLPNMGDIDRQSIAGAVSTDTHGSSIKAGSMSQIVTGMTLVTADGAIYDVPAKEIELVRISLGRLGVIYALELAVVDALYLDHRRTTIDFSTEIPHIRDMLDRHRNLEYWYLPYTERADRLSRDEIGEVDERSYWRLNLQTRLGAQLLDFVGRRFPHRLPGLFRWLAKRRRDEYREGPSHKIFPTVAQATVDSLKTYTMEYQFDFAKLDEAYRELRDSIAAAKDAGVYVSLPIHIRFIPQNESPHSPARWPVTASFSVNLSANHKGVDTWFIDLEQRLTRRDGVGARAHLGKMYYREIDLGPEFESLRARLDPNGVFNNPQPLYQEGSNP